MTKQGMTKLPKYVVYAPFSPDLTHVEMQARAEEFYSAYDEGFECNRYEHGWGPEMAFYATAALRTTGNLRRASIRLPRSSKSV